MQRDISSFPIPPSIRTKLKNAGFSTVEELLDLKPSVLSKELNISKEEALELLKTFKSSKTLVQTSQSSPSSVESPSNTSSPRVAGTSSSHLCSPHAQHAGNTNSPNRRTVTAMEMLHHEQSLPAIVTFCEELDEMLGGGVPMGKITEICGAPGVGKTQLCIQLSVDVQIPVILGGVGGEAIYIDTEGSFIPQRAWNIAQAAVDHCQQLISSEQDTDVVERVSDFTVERILSGIHFFRCHNHVELLALVNLLPEFLSDHPQVKLITVDSIAFHFRHDFDDMSLRTRLLNGLAQSLIRIATQHSLAVVLTNQMTTKFCDGASHLVPALGESWGHACTVRIILYWKDSQRYANLYKSPSKKEATVPYQITVAGVRSATSPASSHQTMGPAGDSAEEPEEAFTDSAEYAATNPRKRPRQEDRVT